MTPQRALNRELLRAIRDERVDKVRIFLFMGADPHYNSDAPLYKALDYPKKEIIEELVSSYSPHTLKRDYLYTACAKGQLETIKTFFRAGVTINKNKAELLRAASPIFKNRSNDELFKLLSELFSKSYKGNFADHPSIKESETAQDKRGLEGSFLNAAKRGDVLEIKAAIEAGVDIETLGGTALAMASYKGYIDTVKELAKVVVPRLDILNNTLYDATSQGYLKIVIELLQLKVLTCDRRRIKVQSVTINNALWKAVAHNQIAIAEVLIKAGATSHRKDMQCSISACKKGFIRMLGVLLNNGAMPILRKTRHLAIACKYGHIEIVKMLLDIGAPIESLGTDALQVAAKEKNLKIVKLLVESSKYDGIRNSLAVSYLRRRHNSVPLALIQLGIYNKNDSKEIFEVSCRRRSSLIVAALIDAGAPFRYDDDYLFRWAIKKDRKKVLTALRNAYQRSI
jgi:ankyrin repeat protein